ncbi:unknown [Akkermansia sp. CAG:344]|nr:unknown [Akkermansia sp. CAG:344]
MFRARDLICESLSVLRSDHAMASPSGMPWVTPTEP